MIIYLFSTGHETMPGDDGSVQEPKAAMTHTDHGGHEGMSGDAGKPHGSMHHGGEPGAHPRGTGFHTHDPEDFKKRFIISAILTIPILFLSATIQLFLGFRFDVPGSGYVLLAFASIVYFYGGYPFLKGIFREIQAHQPGHDDPYRGGDQRRIFL